MKRYFKICLLSPIWLPALVWISAFGLDVLLGDSFARVRLPDWIVVTGFYIAMASLLGGAQYIVALVIVWRKIDFDDYFSWIKGCLVLPLVFTPIQLLGIIPFFLSELKQGRLEALGGFALFDLVFGYAYVLVWLLGFAPIYLIKRKRKELRYG